MAYFNCEARLNKAAGRELSDKELTDIFERINKAANDIKAGRKTPQPGRNGVDGVIDAAAQEAAVQKIADAERTERNAAMQVVKMSQRFDEMKAVTDAGLAPLNALRRLIELNGDGRANKFALEARYNGIAAAMRSGIQDTWLALGGDFMGFVQNKEKIALLAKEMRGLDTGDAMAKKGAAAWKTMTDEFRNRFNDAGGNIGKLDDWGFPQHHSQELVARAGKEAWVNAVLPALDRARYVDDAGVPFNEPRLREFLGKAWETIATNGHNNVEPGQFKGTGARANRHTEQRQIHFADADAYLKYWEAFGEKTFPDILMGHVEGMARDLALVEHFGPNPDAAYRGLRDMALRQQAVSDPTKINAAERDAVLLENLWNTASGKTLPIANRTLARAFDHIRNLNVAGKLGSAFWASFFGDKVMMETVSHLNNLPEIQRWSNEIRLLNPANGAERRLLQRQGLMLEYMTNAMAQWGDNLGQSSWTGKLANSVMRVSGMNAINEWRRGAFGLSLMSALGDSVRTMDFAKVADTDMHLMRSYGIDANDWKLWKLAALDNLGHGNAHALTPEAISNIPDAAIKAAFGENANPQAMRRESITKLLGAVNSESKFAIIEPGWRERSQMRSNVQRGTVTGELWLSFLQFKSFPFTQFERMWDISMSRPTTGGKAGTLAAIMTMQALAGAMIIQTRDLLTGKDPRPMDWKFGLSSFLQGGALGIYGDFLYGVNQTRIGSGPLEAFAGPTIGTGLDFLTSSMNAGKQATEGKDTHLMAKYLQLGKGFIPGNNLWYTKAALDHLIFQNAQEALSPGYLSTMRSRTQKEYGQSWWWNPGEFKPDRAPDFSNALGR
tara:strand:- start:2648 stop:5167 length:2520 start_codon:yes stop_codon:yes gene_type:complete